MHVDPLASMRLWAVTVELGGREFEIPALPAVDWWPVLEAADPLDMFDLLKSTNEDEAADLDDMLLSGVVTGAELGERFIEVIEEITGRSFHAALVLVTAATAQWANVGGLISQTAFRWDQQPIGAALDAVYAVIVGNLEKDPREKFLAVLENESLTTGKPTERQRAKVTAEFESMAGPRPAPAPLPGGASGAPSGSQRPRTRTRPRPPRQDDPPSAPRKPRG